MHKLEMDPASIVEDTSGHVSVYRWTGRQTDGQTDGQGETSIPLSTLLKWGYRKHYIKMATTSLPFYNWHLRKTLYLVACYAVTYSGQRIYKEELCLWLHWFYLAKRLVKVKISSLNLTGRSRDLNVASPHRHKNNRHLQPPEGWHLANVAKKDKSYEVNVFCKFNEIWM